MTQSLPLPYVYKGTNPETNEFYFGSRWGNKVPAYQDLGFEYFTSSKIVEPIFEEFTWEIIEEFETGDEAYDYEQLLIFESWNTKGLLNKHCTHGKERWRITGHTDEAKDKISKANKGENNGMYGKGLSGENAPMHGKHHTEEAIKIMSEAKKGEKNPMFGNHHTPEACKKISESMKNKPKLTCPHCGKECAPSPAKGYHFDNCKQKIVEVRNGIS